jgi:hypothetical protein
MLCLAAFTPYAAAGLIGTLDIATDTGYSGSWEIDGTSLPGDAWYWSHQVAEPGFSAAITMMGEPAAPSLGTSAQIVNGSNEAIEMSIDFTMPIELLGGLVEWSGSQAVTLNGTDVSLSSILDNAVWSADLGGETFLTLLEAPFELSVDGSGSNAASDSASGTLSLVGADTLSVHYLFSIDAGASAVFNGGVGFIPAPSTLAVLCLAFGHRRRRD